MSLDGKIGLIVGVANPESIAAGCAVAARKAGATLALTYLNEKTKTYAAPVAEAVGADLYLPLDVTKESEMEAVFAAIADTYGRLDFLLHSIAFCPKEDLHAPVVEASLAGFLTAMDISCHSLLRMTRAALPLMREGGSVMTISYYGAERVVPHYNLMGPVKAALESCVRYLAADLADRRVRVNAISAGPIRTRAASGIGHFDELLAQAAEQTPAHRLVTIEDVGAMAAFLAGDGARGITGGVHYVDNGFSIMA